MEEMVQVFDIGGMDCADCARKVQTGVQKLPGVRLSELNFATGKLRVIGNSSAEAIQNRINALGYQVIQPEEKQIGKQNRTQSFLLFLWRRYETRLALLGALLILPGLIFNELLGREYIWISWFSTAAVLLAGYPVARSAWQNLKINHAIDINLLMTIAAVGALFIGAYTEAGMVMVLFALGEALEGFTSERARGSIEELLDIVPQEARLLINTEQGVREIPTAVNALNIGDRIVVRPGETIAMDGRVESGVSSVNQAPFTGESQLVVKRISDPVFASSLNGEGALVVEVTHLAGDNTISRVVKLVQEAQSKQAPAQRFIDQFARWYTPLVVVLAALVAIVPPIFFGQPFLNPAENIHGWLYRGLTLLVISCPCALVISTPVSIISAISNAARHGILFKGGLHLETLSKVKVIAFDKTGTLTEGTPVVIAARGLDHREFTELGSECADCSEVVALAHAVEQRSQHPLAQAVANAAEKLGVANRYQAAENVTIKPGLGVEGNVAGRIIQIGSHQWMDGNIAHSQQDCDDLNDSANAGSSQINVAVDGQLQGSLLAIDSLRPSSAKAIKELKELQIEELIMLTGDGSGAAQQIAHQVGMTDFRASLLPEDKLKAIEDLQKLYGRVVMVGDGINDAPALTLADVGIAVRGSNSSAQALESADITLMQADLTQLPFAIRLSRAAMHTIHLNIAFAIVIKAAFMLLAIIGLSSMWMAVMADMGVSVLVTLNGMRLMKKPASHA